MRLWTAGRTQPATFNRSVSEWTARWRDPRCCRPSCEHWRADISIMITSVVLIHCDEPEECRGDGRGSEVSTGCSLHIHVLDDFRVVAVDIVGACSGDWKVAAKRSVEQARLCHQYALVCKERLVATSDDNVRVTLDVEKNSWVPFGASGHVCDVGEA
jgi:hypothetical protein